jgi:hypothetical protein
MNRAVTYWCLGVAGWCFAIGLSAAEPATAEQPTAAATALPEQPVGKALEQAVRSALKDAGSKPLPSESTARRLVELYQALGADESLAKAQRQSLRLAVRSRLQRIGAELRARGPVAAKDPEIEFLARQFPPGGPGAGQPNQPNANSYGPDLVEVIEETIVPDSWEKRGGPGVIRFWPPGNALVVRQTTEVHEALGQLLRDLR